MTIYTEAHRRKINKETDALNYCSVPFKPWLTLEAQLTLCYWWWGHQNKNILHFSKILTIEVHLEQDGEKSRVVPEIIQ